MPHLLKLRIDSSDEFRSMRDAGPPVGETTEWGSFGKGAEYQAAGDLKYIREGNLQVGDKVVVRERQRADEVFFAAVLEVVDLVTTASGVYTPRYRVIERFDGSQSFDRLKVDAPDLAMLPHFQKNAKGMMHRALTELSDDEFDLITSAARASDRNGLRPLWPRFEPGERIDAEWDDEAVTFTADDEGFAPIEYIEWIQARGGLPYAPVPITPGQIPVPSLAKQLQLMNLLLKLEGAGAHGRQAELDAWRDDTGDDLFELALMLRACRPCTGLSFNQFDVVGVALVSESEIIVYPKRSSSGISLSGDEVTGFWRANEGIPVEDEEFDHFTGSFVDAVEFWRGANRSIGTNE